MHVTKVYFIQLLLKIKYVEFEDRPKIFIKNLWVCEVYLRETDKRIAKNEHWMTFLQKLQTTVRSNVL